MQDVVYILKNTTKNLFHIRKSVELLKNIERNKIYCIGKNPNIKSVIHVPYPDNLKREANMIAKILHACDMPEISDPFVLMNDDIFILEPYRVGIHYKYDLEEEWQDTDYVKMCKNTLNELKKLNLPTMNYECHLPILIYKDIYKKAMSLVDWKNKILCFSVYGNYIQQKEKSIASIVTIADDARDNQKSVMSTFDILTKEQKCLLS